MILDSIRIRQARQNNLRGVDVDLPRHKLIGITGVSGSGKSSLAFDTLFREGQRRFLETLSAYARQFLGRMEKPDVESLEGLSPAIAVDQKTVSRGSRSTVGTLTEIVDHLRVLYARAGQAHCPACDLAVASQTPEAIVQQILLHSAGQRVQVLAPVVRDRKGYHKTTLDGLARKGYMRARVDGVFLRIEDAPELERYKRHTIEAVVDRIKPDPADPARLREAVDAALELSDGDVVVHTDEGDTRYSTQRSCPGCGTLVPPLEPRLFSFNSPHGACEECKGLGVLRQPSETAVVANAALSIRHGALAVTRASGGAFLFPRVDFEFMSKVAGAHGFGLDTPWQDLSAAARKIILQGTGDERFEDRAEWNGKRSSGSATFKRRYEGVIPALIKGQDKGIHKRIARRFLDTVICTECAGTRLKPAARAVKLGGQILQEFTHCPVASLPERIEALELSKREARIAIDLLNEVKRRVAFLLSLGLGYLTLDRGADTLSGGEAQRIRLAAQLGAGLQGVLYILDEPSIGLHWRDQGRLLGALERLRDAGNTVVVVEHDEATLRAADFLVDVGPGAGIHGGQICGAGSPAEVAKLDTPTGRMLRGEIQMPAPDQRRSGNGKLLCIREARGFNLKDIDVEFRLGTLTCVSGVSGSGKSTLVDSILRRALERHLGREAPHPAPHGRIEGLEHIDELVCIDSAPIGRTPRSNPATYTGVLGPIRDLFASLPESRMRGYTKSRFSFNVAGGRCEDCSGAGAKFVELQFLAPVTVPCEECGGHRFQAETLHIRYKHKSIADVLAMNIAEAAEFFKSLPKIARPLAVMNEVGLGYLTLGQPSTTLSGGEAQRIKLAKELSRRPKKHTLYLLDEPTTGLHLADVARLVAALQKLVDMGHSVLVIEHNLEVLWAADQVIDIGPEGGQAGGQIVVAGTPEEVRANQDSHTGAALRSMQAGHTQALEEVRGLEPAAPLDCIRVVEARTHNLQRLSVDIPRDALTVISGRSGSGKSSLALDTIFTEGRRRFVESLSTYARQFLGSRDRPPVERIEGLGPAVAVEARTARGGPRSTIATTCEIHDYLRVLWARAGQPLCPEHGTKLEASDPSRLAARILKEHPKKNGWLVAPVFGPGCEEPEDLAAAFAERRDPWRAAGFVRVLVDGVEERLGEDGPIPTAGARVDLVLDRVQLDSSSKSRLSEAIEQAGSLSDGRVSFQIKGGARHEYSTSGICPDCGFRLTEEPEPRHFSFNTHVGACETCDGLGEVLQCDADELILEPDEPLCDGAIPGKLGRYLVKGKGFYELLLREVARSHRINLNRPYRDLSEKHRALIEHGVGARKQYKVSRERHTENADIEEDFSSDWPGLCGHVDAWYAKAEEANWRAVIEPVMNRRVCRACKGERLKPEWRAVTISRKRLPEVLALSVEETLEWLSKVKLKKSAQLAVGAVLDELGSRVSLLERVGLGYLTLDRRTQTLSGGEARRVRLSASLGSQLVGVTYVLDEPTVGLHPQDVERLGDALLEMRDRGNTVIVVEHDKALMQRADWIVDVGPGAGRLGGQLVAAGTPAEIAAHRESLTGAALRGERNLAGIKPPDADAGPRALAAAPLLLSGATTHNLRGVDFEFSHGELVGVCGPSGSGKSSLIFETLIPALEGEAPDGRWKNLRGRIGGNGRVVVVDSSPIGRTPSSTPATYSGLIEPLRELYARTPEARMRGFGPAHFSFNSARGRCPACEGRGALKIEMQFLPDLWLDCEECDGKRYRPEVLDVQHRGKSVADVLAMSVDEALEHFATQPRLERILASLSEVGLGYLGLAQSSTTLSGGEAQRLKLASELFQARKGSRSAIFLDEPTTGLHPVDVDQLLHVLVALARRGNAVVVVEHNTDVLEACDRLVELGPAGGADGGLEIAQGTPHELAQNPKSKTGPYLFPAAAIPAGRSARKSARKSGATKKASKKSAARPKAKARRKTTSGGKCTP
jgi:excinuclease ABC subunit A